VKVFEGRVQRGWEAERFGLLEEQSSGAEMVFRLLGFADKGCALVGWLERTELFLGASLAPLGQAIQGTGCGAEAFDFETAFLEH
jgi:hypothetical protein